MRSLAFEESGFGDKFCFPRPLGRSMHVDEWQRGTDAAVRTAIEYVQFVLAVTKFALWIKPG